MKALKPIVFFLFLCIGIDSLAQKGGERPAFEEGLVIVDVSTGLGRYYGMRDFLSTRLPVFLTVNYAFERRFSAGIYGGWRETTFKFAPFAPVAVNYYNAGARFDWHFTEYINQATIFNLPTYKYDFYAGLHAGLQFNNAKNTTAALQIGQRPVRVLGAHLGFRLYTAGPFGFMVELGLTPSSIFGFGVSARF